MHDLASLNFQITFASETHLSAVSSSALYGKGVFTTIAIFGSEPFLWEKHWHRLNSNAKTIGVDLSEFDENRVKDQLQKLVEKNSVIQGRCRITFFDESSSKIWSDDLGQQTSLLVQTADLVEFNEVFSLTFSGFPINSKSPLSGVKSCNYLDNLLALEDARSKEFDEAIRLNERGEIVSACMANIFWVKEEQLFTPNLETGCLAGTTRELILERFKVLEVSAKSSEINKSDEIFLTSAGIGLRPASINQIRGKYKPTYIYSKLQKTLDLCELYT